MVSRGVFAGTSRPHHTVASKPGRPESVAVGTFGSSGSGFGRGSGAGSGGVQQQQQGGGVTVNVYGSVISDRDLMDIIARAERNGYGQR